MDERLEKALDFGNYSVTLNNQKRLLKEKFYDDCIMYQNGDDASNQYADAANQYFKAYKEMIANRKPGALVGYV